MKQIALVVMAAIAGLFLAFFTLAATLPPVTLAITLVLIVLFGLIVGAPMFWLLARLTRATEIRPPRRAPSHRLQPRIELGAPTAATDRRAALRADGASAPPGPATPRA